MRIKIKQKNMTETRRLEDGRTIYIHKDHPAPVTRREFLSRGFISFSAYAMMPSVLGMIATQRAYGAACPSEAASQMIPHITFDMSGGAAIHNFVVPRALGLDNGGGDFLTSYSQLGLLTPTATGAIDVRFGSPIPVANGAQPGVGFLTGLLNPLGANGGGAIDALAISNTKIGSVWHPSNADSSNNPHHAIQLVTAAGLKGKFVATGTGTQNSDSGANSTVPMTNPSLKPLRITSLSDFVNALAFGQALDLLPKGAKDALAKATLNLSAQQAARVNSMALSEQFSFLVGCGMQKNQEFTNGATGVDPRADTDAQAIYGIAAGSGVTTSQVVEATIVYNAIMGNSGPATMQVGGADYHNGNYTDGQNYDTGIGRRVGRALTLAARKGKPVFIEVITDGSLQGNATGWTGDTNTGGRVMIYFDPAKVPTFARDPQLGYYVAGQAASSTTFLGNQLSPNPTYAAFYNWLAINGKAGTFRQFVSTTQFPDPPGGLDKMRIFA